MAGVNDAKHFPLPHPSQALRRLRPITGLWRILKQKVNNVNLKISQRMGLEPQPRLYLSNRTRPSSSETNP
jgi:hypothetical protein